MKTTTIQRILVNMACGWPAYLLYLGTWAMLGWSMFSMIEDFWDNLDNVIGWLGVVFSWSIIMSIRGDLRKLRDMTREDEDEVL